MKRRITNEEIEQAITRTAGNISVAARSLGVSRMTLYRRIQKSSNLSEVLEDTRERFVDDAESMLRHLVSVGNVAAIIFTLKTQGKSRGYVERNEFTGADGGPIVVVNWDEYEANSHD